MKIPTLLFILIAALGAPRPAHAGERLADDATLTRGLVGYWHEYRHDTQFLTDGTWKMDPVHGDGSHGHWQVRKGKIIKSWRFEGEAKDSVTTDEIVRLDHDTLQIRILSQTGPGRPEGVKYPSQIFTLERIPASRSQ